MLPWVANTHAFASGPTLQLHAGEQAITTCKGTLSCCSRPGTAHTVTLPATIRYAESALLHRRHLATVEPVPVSLLWSLVWTRGHWLYIRHAGRGQFCDVSRVGWPLSGP